MTIKQKTIGLFIFFITIFLLGVSGSLIVYQRLCRHQEALHRAARIRATVLQVRRAEAVLLRHASADAARAVDDLVAELVPVKAFAPQLASYTAALSALRERPLTPDADDMVAAEVERGGAELERLAADVQRQQEEAFLDARRKGRRLQMGIIIFCLSGIGIAMGITLHMIFAPLKQLQRLFKGVPQEGLLCERHIPIESAYLRGINFKDEIGALARAYLDMAARWNNTCWGLKEKMKETESLYKVKSEFTSVVSHELRTPLTAIKEGIDYVFDGTAGVINDEQREFLEIAKRNVDRLARLINNVLDFTKLNTPQMPFRNEPVVLNEIILSAVNFYRLVSEKKGLTLGANLAATEGLSMMLDADRVNQVLSNLLNNAIKFTEQGRVEVSTRVDSDSNVAEVAVADSGPGMRPEDISRLFRPFTQLGEQKSRKPGGTGLGLAICKQIIERMGGKIWAESEWGNGSRFHFILPLQERRKVSKRI